MKKCNDVQARIHTGFHRFTEIGQIFHNKYIFDKKKLSKLKYKKIEWTNASSEYKHLARTWSSISDFFFYSYDMIVVEERFNLLGIK